MSRAVERSTLPTRRRVAPGLHPGHHRGLRHLRRDRRRARRSPSRCCPDRAWCRSSAGWRSTPRRPRCRRSPTPCSTSSTTPTRAPTATPRGSWRSRRCATCSPPSAPRACPTRPSSTPRSHADIAALVALQNDDGGFAIWQRGAAVEPVDYVQATHALVLADGGRVPRARATRCGAALATSPTSSRTSPPSGARGPRHAQRLRALRARTWPATATRRRREALYQRADDTLPLDALAWLWPVVDDRRRPTPPSSAPIANRGHRDAGRGQLHHRLSSERRLPAAALGSPHRRHRARRADHRAARQRPDPQGRRPACSGNQAKGRWGNVQENGFILLALKRYFDTFEAATPDFVARVWLGDTYAAEHALRRAARPTGPHTLVPMTELIAGGDPDIVLSKDGHGPALLPPRPALRARRPRASIRSTRASSSTGPTRRSTTRPTSTPRRRRHLAHQARRHGAGAADDGGRQPAHPHGPGRPAAGRPGDRQPGPGRLARPRPGRAGDQRRRDGAVDTDRGGAGAGTWYDHQNLRDDRAEAFTSLPPGRHLRATPTSPGPPPPAPSSPRRPRPRRSTPPRPSAAPPPTPWWSG